MTITYTGEVANARMFGFSRLLCYWRGSIYKLMYKEMSVFCVLYGCLSLIYRFCLNQDQRGLFEKIALHCETFTSLIPLSFVLGFYVSIIITRWWNQFLNIPWPDRAMVFVSTMIDGSDEKTRLLRRTLMRYLTLSSLIVYQATSVVVKKRFPTMEHLLDAGVITLPEIQALEEVNTPHGKWWVPIVWACNLVREARKEGKIHDHYSMKTILDEIQTFRSQLGTLYSHDWISVPLVYTQVTTLAVYTFFVGCLLGRQFLDPIKGYPGHEVDLIVPVFTLLQFFFYMGWLKVAEQLINPFGEDDDDFDINWVIDRNLQVSLLVVDDLHGATPHVERDIYFGESPPDFLPYTKSSISSLKQPYMGSTADLSISDQGMRIVNHMTTIQEGSVLDSNIISPYGVPASTVHSKPNSPMPSPTKSRRIYNMLQGIRTPLAGSKSSIDCSKLSVSDSKHNNGPFLNLSQNLHGVGINQRHFVDGNISEPNSNAGTPTTLFLAKTPPFQFGHQCDSNGPTAPSSPLDERSIFMMEMGDHGDVRSPSVCDMKNICLENPDVARVKFLECSNRRFTVTEIPDDALHHHPNINKHESNSPEITSSHDVSPPKTLAIVRPNNAPEEICHEKDKDIPEIVIDGDSESNRTRHLSNSSSSCSSLPGYEVADSHQATVSSLTPLIDHSNASEEEV